MNKKITAAHILVEKEFEIQDIQKKLADGTPFEQLAKDFSMCGSAEQGGNLGEFGKGMMVKPFEEVAFALEVDQVSDIVPTQFGYHLIKRLA